MKKYIISAFAGLALMTSCVDLDLNPLSEGSSENWFSTEQEITLALNALYNPDLWYIEANRFGHTDRYSDDWNQRNKLYEYMAGTFHSTLGDVTSAWNTNYKGIARANTILYSLDNAVEGMTADKVAQYAAEAKFFRATFYMYLITAFGDVPFYTEYMTLEQAYEMGRTDREVVLQQIYKDLNEAAEDLPTSYAGTQRITKGAAYAMKARAALYMSDWKTCAEAAKKCMDLNVYSLHEDYEEFFHSHTKSSPELIFALYYSNELGINTFNADLKSFMPRCPGKTSTAQPSWELFFAFTCTDGKNVEDSPLYDPANPFANRDPRLAATMVEFGVEFLDYIYDPRPSAKTTTRVSTGDSTIKNVDNLTVNENASYNAMSLRKHIDDEWLDNYTDAPIRLMRYADVLLMYAEAKMEMGELDADLYKAINSVRARAYKCEYTETDKYPAVTETDQNLLRRIIRNERRCELSWENRRWFDLVRWRACETALKAKVYDLKHGKATDNEKAGYWIFPKDFRPVMRDDSTIDLSGIEQYPNYTHVAVERAFAAREYLFPIPLDDRTICYNLTQNPGY